ncbi:hypothetical protein RFN29_15245 [Mesorhizobium sp. VK22B]|uniref:Uncharacterized protein n=1 Tax=Mesorhizobium captivum TaxID=3072319 RepID=A0ABU4Z1K1_9HYPH|nr:hypothetical protein [Mesorhizobium sp. VK22B]MDX8492933.1 hypothetical protein [Mesorhizobium sp. VK22B]
MIELEEGKTYRSRSGNKIGPVRAGPDGTFYFLGRYYQRDGNYHADGETSALDLIEEWQEPAETPEPPAEHVMQFFAFAHLPPTLKEISRPFGQMAEDIVRKLPRNQQRTMALNKLLEAKDAAVRAYIAK